MMGFIRTVLSAFVVIAAASYFWNIYNSPKKTNIAPAGWDTLSECEPFSFFDDTKSLEFSIDHKVIFIENKNEATKAPENRTDGRWSFDQHKGRYVVTVGGSSFDYALVRPENSSVCILASGDVNAADLQKSWFGQIEIDAPEPEKPF